MKSYWDELLSRVQFIRGLYKQHKIALKLGGGLTVALDEAEAAVMGVNTGNAPMDSVCACHAIFALHDSLNGCITAGLDITNHLRQLTTGTTDFGVPANKGNQKTIFFKDFEAELFVAATLANAHLPVKFLKKPNDPRGEMRVNDILIQVKHLNSRKRLEFRMRDFNGELSRDRAFGFFVAALEDAFNLANHKGFPTKADVQAWECQKRAEMEKLGCKLVLCAARLPAIAGLAQTSSSVVAIGGESRLHRYSNSLVFDHRQYPAETIEDVEKIASVFNPRFRRYSQVQHLLAE